MPHEPERRAHCCEEMAAMTRLIEGNGSPGLAQIVATDHSFLDQARGMINLVKWISVLQVLSVGIAIYQLVRK